MKRNILAIALVLGILWTGSQSLEAQNYSGLYPTVDFQCHNAYLGGGQFSPVLPGDTLARIRFRGRVPGGFFTSGTEIMAWITGPVTNTSFESNLNFRTNLRDRLTILHNGNVGINTTGAQQLLTLSHAETPVFRFDRADPGNFDFEIYQADGGLFFRGGADAVGAGLHEFVVIDDIGRVGIGTTVPDQKLTVSDAEPVFRLERNGGGQFDFELVNAIGGDLRFRGGANDTGPGLNELVTFTASGNVGIGTTAPAQKLTVSDGEPVVRLEADGAGAPDFEVMNTSGGDLRFRGGADGTGAGLDDLVTFTASGRVGIGTTAPDQLLTLSHSSNPVLRLDRSAAGQFDMELSLQDDGSLFFRGGADDLGGNLNDLMVLSSDGKLAVGTTQFPTSIGGTDISAYSLFAAGGVLTEEVRVRTGWADYVFDPEYELRSLTEVDAYIRRYGRLPGMPSAEEVERQGLELGDIAVRQQEKIEELFLHLIDMQKQLEALQAENAELKARLQALER